MRCTINRLLLFLISFHVGFMVSLLEHSMLPIQQVIDPRPSYSSRSVTLESFNPSLHPVIKNFNRSTKVRVGLIVDENGPMGEGKHVMYDGIVGSEYMDLVGIYHVNKEDHETFENVQLWVLDNIRAGPHIIEDEFVLNLFTNSTVQLLLIDFHDNPHWAANSSYFEELGILYRPHIRIAQRSIVTDRHLIDDISIDLGFVMDNVGSAGGPMLHMSYCVRNDIFEEIMQQPVSLFFTNRTMDVLHLWPPNDSRYFASYRSQASIVVESMNGRTVAGRSLRAYAGLQGKFGHEGRQSVSALYVKALLSTKIVVVTQRDMWEDSYRLMEALAGGAMVLADAMLAPPRGLENGIHLLFFSSLRQLENLTVYYIEHEGQRLRIAQSGWDAVLSKHRAWHSMEDIVFGKALTGSKHHLSRLSLLDFP